MKRPKAKAPTPDPRQSPSIEPAKATAAPQAPAKTEQAAAAPTRERTLRDRLGAAIPDFKETEAETETPPPFGRAKRLASDDEAVDLDAAMPSQGDGGASSIRSRLGMGLDAEPDAPDDLVAAARRAAQAAALRAEGRGGRRSSNPLPGSAAEQPGRRKRSFLIIAAAVLLVLSALLLYSRLGSRPEPAAPEIEQITPAPSEGSGEDMTAPDTDGAAPAAEPEKSGSWEPKPNMNENPSDSAASGDHGLHRDGQVFRRPRAPDAGERADPRAAAGFAEAVGHGRDAVGRDLLHRGSVLRPHSAAQRAKPAQLPLPPEALGPLPLREAAAKGDAAAQYAIATRYAEGVGTKADPKEAAKWLEHAAAAGLAPGPVPPRRHV